MTVFALLAGIAIGVALGYLLARNRLGTAAATAAERARAAQERAALLERQAAEKAALAEGQLAQRFDVESLVAPMRETLARVEQQLRDSDIARTRSHAELAQQVEFTRRGAEQLREQTQALVSALRRPEARGRWGELQLRRVVELAGMVAHVDFDEQVVVEGGQRPDMVVRLAGGKNVVVDSKVSLAAYLEAAATVDDGSRETRLAAHARHLRAHVEQLGSKAYWSALPETPEFVVMFVPGEAFLAPALEHDPGLLEHALSRRVHIATPTTLVSMLRTVQYAWQQQALSENARAVFELGRELYDRLAGLGRHLERVGKSLTSAVGSYNQAVGTLESRVLVSARKLAALGVVDGELPAPDAIADTARPLAAPEFAEDDLERELLPELFPQLSRELEGHPLPDRLDLFHVVEAERGELAEHAGDQFLRHGGPAGHTHGDHPGEPAVVDLARVIDQVGGPRPRVLGHLDESHRVGGVRRAHHDYQVALGRDRLDRGLPVLRGVADVVARRVDQLGEAVLEGGHRGDRLIDGQRGLGEPHDLGRVAHLDACHAIRPVDQVDARGRLAGRADDLLVPLVADQQDVVVAGGEPPRLVVHLGDERAGGVDGRQPPPHGLLANRRRDAVRGEHDDAALRHLLGLLDEDGAPLLQLAHHMGVVHDLLAHVYRCAEPAERDLHGLHGPVYPSAVAARLRHQDPAVGLRHASHGRRGRRPRMPRPACDASAPGHQLSVYWPIFGKRYVPPLLTHTGRPARCGKLVPTITVRSVK
jgi:DNA recombination protein RmuC